jgi:hypothetical protein
VQSVGARLEHSSSIAASVADLWLQGLPLDYYRSYAGKLAQETPESLTPRASALDLERLIIVVVGDRAVIEAPLKSLGYQVDEAPRDLLE